MVNISDIRGEVLDLFNKKTDDLYSTGFKSLDDYYRIKLGSTTYVIGIPSHGKSEITMEILINLSTLYGWRHILFTPETGSPAEVVAELCNKYTKLPFFTKAGQRMDERRLLDAMNWVDHHFTLVDNMSNDNSLSVDEILEEAAKIKKDKDTNTLTVDVFNELRHDINAYGGREDLYLEQVLGKIRRFSRNNNIHTFVVTHPRTMVMDNEGNYKAPTAYEIKGGAMWYNKGESIFSIYRPNYMSNDACITILKAKPKIVGQKGQVTLYFDTVKSRYYERDISTGHPRYAAESLKETIREANEVNMVSEYIKEKIQPQKVKLRGNTEEKFWDDIANK